MIDDYVRAQVKAEAASIVQQLAAMPLEERIKNPHYQNLICKNVCTQYKFFDMMFPRYHITQSVTGHFNPGRLQDLPQHAS